MTLAPVDAPVGAAIDAPVRAGAESRWPAAIEDLVRSHLPLAHHLVREFAGRVPAHVDRDALTSAALCALTSSAQAFDPAVGAAFSTFAAARIRGALLDELRAMDWASRSVRTRSRQIEVARQHLADVLGRTPTAEELGAATGLSAGDMAAIEADVHRATVHSLEALGPERWESMPATADGPEALVLRREQLTYLRAAVAELPERLRYVVIEYFFGNRKMADIAAELNVTESRVSQLRSEALRWLEAGLRTAMDGVEELAEQRADGRRRAERAYPAAVAATARARATAALGDTA